jgi:hypothetical protein
MSQNEFFYIDYGDGSREICETQTQFLGWNIVQDANSLM